MVASDYYDVAGESAKAEAARAMQQQQQQQQQQKHDKRSADDLEKELGL